MFSGGIEILLIRLKWLNIRSEMWRWCHRFDGFILEMHAVLLDDLLVLLQKQDDGNKYLLKRYNVDNKVSQ